MKVFDVISMFADEVEMAEEDLLAMEFALEEFYENKIAENILYFGQTKEKLIESNAIVLEELTKLMDEFIAKDEFEKCSVVKKVTGLMKIKIDEVNSSSKN